MPCTLQRFPSLSPVRRKSRRLQSKFLAPPHRFCAVSTGLWLRRDVLAESKDVGQAMELQTEHARKQMESFVHQLEEIRDLATQVIQESTPSGMPGVGKQ
jgi:Phasin protein